MTTENNPILLKPSLILIPNKVINYLDDKVNSYKKFKLSSASFQERIGCLTGFETIKTDVDCGGYCDVWNKEIALVEFSDRIFMHEICHAFQMDMGFFDVEQKLISQSIKSEQQCESMARYLFEKINNKSGKNIFNTYFSKEDMFWLADWYGDYRENDIL